MQGGNIQNNTTGIYIKRRRWRKNVGDKTLKAERHVKSKCHLNSKNHVDVKTSCCSHIKLENNVGDDGFYVTTPGVIILKVVSLREWIPELLMNGLSLLFTIAKNK